MRIAIASDHAGFRYKTTLSRWLAERGHDVVDLGTISEEPVDYPDVTPAAEAVARGLCERGIVMGGLAMAKRWRPTVFAESAVRSAGTKSRLGWRGATTMPT